MLNKIIELEKRHNESLENQISLVLKNNENIDIIDDGEVVFTGTFKDVENEINFVIEMNKMSALANAKNCLYHGCGKTLWNDCGLSKNVAHEIWEQAKKEMERL